MKIYFPLRYQKLKQGKINRGEMMYIRCKNTGKLLWSLNLLFTYSSNSDQQNCSRETSRLETLETGPDCPSSTQHPPPFCRKGGSCSGVCHLVCFYGILRGGVLVEVELNKLIALQFNGRPA